MEKTQCINDPKRKVYPPQNCIFYRQNFFGVFWTIISENRFWAHPTGSMLASNWLNSLFNRKREHFQYASHVDRIPYDDLKLKIFQKLLDFFYYHKWLRDSGPGLGALARARSPFSVFDPGHSPFSIPNGQPNVTPVASTGCLSEQLAWSWKREKDVLT